MKQKLSEQDIILKAVTALAKLFKKTSLLENEKTPLQKTSEELMTKYGEQNVVVGSSAEKLVKTASTRFVGMSICISKAIGKQWFR